MACPDLRATQGPEEKVGSLARACARFVPNFGPKAGRKDQFGPKTGRFNLGGPRVEFRDGPLDTVFSPDFAAALAFRAEVRTALRG